MARESSIPEKNGTGRRQTPHIGYIVSLCGIMSGLAVASMFLLSFIPSFEYITPAVAGILIWIIRDRLGVKYGLISYLAVGILSMLITPNYEAVMMYIFLLGYYPIIRDYLEKIRPAVIRWIVKLLVFAATSISCYILLINLFGLTQLLDEAQDFGKYGTLIILGMGAAAFIVYDIFLGLFKPFYDKLVKPKIQKRMR